MSEPLELARAAVAEARRAAGGALDQADARVGEEAREQIAVRDGALEWLSADDSNGVGVRVLVDGAWGFAAVPGHREASAIAAARRAVEVARAAASLRRRPVRLCEEEPQQGRWETPIAIDPFAVPLERKLADLTAACDALRDRSPRVRSTHAHFFCRRSRTALATSNGTAVEQTLVLTGGGAKIVCGDGSIVQQRSHPADLDGGVAAKGYEQVALLDLTGTAPRLRDEALALCDAPPCPSGRKTIILHPSQLALQIHESCGHPTESDRALGEELSLAGASFLSPDRLGRFRYGSRHVNLTADARTAGGLGTFGWDDEGVPARRTPLVARGQFVGYLTSRETAERLGVGRSGGCMRAESWCRPPLVRMVNVSLEPDPDGPSLAELIADTKDGLLLAQNRSWSIDDLRLNFQFGCEIGWEIAHGRITRPVRNPIYGGSTPSFWSSCDAVCRPSELELWGFVSCGKGDPIQMLPVGHGCPPARFRDVTVGAR